MASFLKKVEVGSATPRVCVDKWLELTLTDLSIKIQLLTLGGSQINALGLIGLIFCIVEDVCIQKLDIYSQVLLSDMIDQFQNPSPGIVVRDFPLSYFLPSNIKYIGLGISQFIIRGKTTVRLLSYSKYSIKVETRVEPYGGWWDPIYYVLYSNWGIIYQHK